MAGIFISYRRDDSRGFAGRAADDLSDLFGADLVFRDVEIPPGSDFSDVLQHAISASDVLLVVIGPRWADQSQTGYGRRLFEPTDWVRIELETAFAQGKHVIPVLVDGASMPPPELLPAEIGPLLRRQAAVLSDLHWQADIAALVKRLRELCPSLDAPMSKAERGNSPADVLRDLRERILDEVATRRAPRRVPSRSPPSLGGLVTARIGRFLGSVATLTIALVLIYVALRLFGDAATLRQLDALDARLAVGWQRLLDYLRSS